MGLLVFLAQCTRFDICFQAIIVGRLVFLTQCTRFDICFVVREAPNLMCRPNSIHMPYAKRILLYGRGTPDLPIIYKRDGDVELSGFCDASYGTSDPDKIPSSTDTMLFLSGKLVHFSSSLQKISAQTTTEGELIATST